MAAVSGVIEFVGSAESHVGLPGKSFPKDEWLMQGRHGLNGERLCGSCQPVVQDIGLRTRVPQLQCG